MAVAQPAIDRPCLKGVAAPMVPLRRRIGITLAREKSLPALKRSQNEGGLDIGKTLAIDLHEELAWELA